MRRRVSPGVVAIVCLGLLIPALGAVLAIGLIPGGSSSADPTSIATTRPVFGSGGTMTEVPAGTGEVSENDYPGGWDSPGDTPVTPDADLTQAEIEALLQTGAAAAVGTTCSPEDVTLSLRVVDAAAGTIFGYLLAQASESCSLAGWPGLGARGEWGDPLPMAIEPEARGWDGTPLEADVVTLATGDCAIVPLRWTGERAGAFSQGMSTAVVQVDEGSPATLVGNAPRGAGDWIDWTIATRLYPGPWQPDPGFCQG